MDANNMHSPNQQIFFGTPGTIQTRTPVINPTKPQTPRNGSTTNHNSTATFYTPNAMQRKNGRFRLFNVASKTPPGIKKIINPFEAALTERLHLPLICSPSLFNRPSTPQLSSTHFEWTIEDVSSLNPANVEAHETQFMSVIDPEEEAKFQAAISSYFKDKLIVPSPADCKLRNQKIILPSKASSGVIKRPKRDGVCQTELTLPPQLPKEIEDLLRPYFSYTVDQQQSPYKLNCDTSATMDHDARDASLRRKLFGSLPNQSDSSSDDDLQCSLSALSPPPESPKLGPKSLNTRNFDSPECLNKTMDASLSPVKDISSSFGSISPILKKSATTPNRFNRNSSYLSSSSIYRSTPDRASIVYRTCSARSINNMSIDTSAVVSSAGSDFMNRSNLARHKSLSASIHSESDIHMMSTKALSESLVSNGSQHLETPTRRHRQRRVGRKNLSHSFTSLAFLDNVVNATAKATNNEAQQFFVETKNCQEPQTVALSKTDSGFNDMEE